jgi:hypothetical protein
MYYPHSEICVTPLFLGVSLLTSLTVIEVFNAFLYEWIGMSTNKLIEEISLRNLKISLLEKENSHYKKRMNEDETQFREFIDRLETQISKYEFEIGEFKTKFGLDDTQG